MKGGLEKSGTWKYFEQHILNGVKYGRCKDDGCPSKTQKKKRKTEHEVNGQTLIRCTGSNTASLWYHLEAFHPDIFKEESALKEKKKREKQEEELAAFSFTQKQGPTQSKVPMFTKKPGGPKYKKVILHKKRSTRTLRILW